MLFYCTGLDAVLNVIKKVALRLAEKPFCKQAIADKANLAAIRARPSKSAIAGLVMVGFSYVIGLPAIIVLGILAVWIKDARVAVIGGPLIYGISTLMFIIGIKMAGKQYFRSFMRWLTRIGLEKILGKDICQVTQEQLDAAGVKEDRL